jgi:riboflavin synthase
MFTGIIQDIGSITEIVKSGDWLLTIKTDKLSLASTTIGASIACSGICLTVIAKTTDTFQVQASTETLNKTNMLHWQKGTRINLEPALRMGDELGGHLVTGHIDGIAFVTAKHKEGDSIRLQFEVPPLFSRFLAPKGSAVVEGVSLTVNEIADNRFGVNIIPHTQTATTLGTLAIGDEVNFEVDMIARYVERLLHK